MDLEMYCGPQGLHAGCGVMETVCGAMEPARASVDGARAADAGVALRGVLVDGYARLHRRLQRHLGCADRASDCLHDAWLRLGDATLPADVRHPEAYVYRVACNLATDRVRGERAWRYTGDGDAMLDDLADFSPGPERIAETRSELAAVDRAMRLMPRRQRAVFMALRIDEMSREEVAGRYGLSLRNVDTAVRQALTCCASFTGQPAIAPGLRGGGEADVEAPVIESYREGGSAMPA